MGISVTYVSQLTIQDTLTNQFLDATGNQLTISGLNTRTTLTASTAPAATVFSAFAKAMSVGAATIDLTAMPSIDGTGTVSASTLKLEAWKFKNPATNTGAITIVPGASSGYDVFGAASLLILKPGQEASGLGASVAQTVGNTHKTIDISGTGSESLYCELVFGG